MPDDIAIVDAPATTNELPTSTDETVQLPNPVNTEATPEEKAEVEAKAVADKTAKKLSVRETLEAAAAKVDKDDKAVEPKDDSSKSDSSKQEQPRENGKFVSTKPVEVAKPVTDAPSRFAPEAKAAWASTPDPVRTEVSRTVRELETGIQEHQRRWSEIKEYDDLAKQTGTSLAAAMKQYVGIDKMLGENFPAAITRIFQNRGVDMRSFAADVLQLPQESRQALRIGGQPQNLPQAPSREVQMMQREIEGLKQHLSGVTGTIQSQQEQSLMAELDQFAADKPMFSELSNEIAAYITNDGLSYQDAYAKAVEDFNAKVARAGFIPQSRQAAPPEAQTLAGKKSIKGAPGPGSSPATKKPSNSIRDALERAQGMVG